MSTNALVYQEKRYYVVAKEAAYSDVIFFEHADKYTSVWHMHNGVVRELISRITLQEVKSTHPELVWVRHGVLAKQDMLEDMQKEGSSVYAYYSVAIRGTNRRINVARRQIPAVRKAMGIKHSTIKDNRAPTEHQFKRQADYEKTMATAL